MFRPGADSCVDEDRWPASVPAVAQLLREGLEVPAGLTVLVGENGSGKSTVVETLAEAYGLNPQGGSALAKSFLIRQTEPGIGSELTVVRGARPRWSYFLRADTMHLLYTYSPILAAVPGARLLELGAWGIRPASWDDLDLVVAWRQFMRDPRSFFRHLLEDSL
jgi:predicted ATPase